MVETAFFKQFKVSLVVGMNPAIRGLQMRLNRAQTMHANISLSLGNISAEVEVVSEANFMRHTNSTHTKKLLFHPTTAGVIGDYVSFFAVKQCI